MIEIHTITKDRNRLVIDVSIKGRRELIQYIYSENVQEFILSDRCDAAVVGLLILAVRLKCDIKSQIPISNTLYYKLVNHFIPGICTGDIYRPTLNIPTIEDYVSGSDNKMVATGMSCGVDSLYTVMSHTSHSEEFDINHLVYLTAGASNFKKTRRLRNVYTTGGKILRQNLLKKPTCRWLR